VQKTKFQNPEENVMLIFLHLAVTAQALRMLQTNVERASKH